MRYLRGLADEIRKKHPEHAAEIDKVMAELGLMHDNLLKQAKTRINEAEQSQGHHMFDKAADDLLDWVYKTTNTILNEPIGGVSAEELVKKHMELKDEINAKDYEFDYVYELGRRLLSKNPRLTHVTKKLDEIAAAKRALEDAWKRRDYEYKQLFDLQVFNREADRIDALTKGKD